MLFSTNNQFDPYCQLTNEKFLCGELYMCTVDPLKTNITYKLIGQNTKSEL